MKTKIDELVRIINHNLSQPTHATPDMAASIKAKHFQSIKADPLSIARDTRDILKRWAEDMGFSPDVRNYAQQQFDALPAFE